MTDLIRDLEAATLLAHKVQQCSSQTNVDAFNKAAGKVLYMHHAEIAEAVRCRQAIISQCMVTEAVTPDLDRPYETISRVTDYYIAMHNSAGDEG